MILRNHMPRKAITLIETLVVLAILGTLMALLLPAIQRVREAALCIQSKNNVRQVLLATHHFADTHDGVLPNVEGYDYRTGSSEWSLLLSLLPYIEQGNIYQDWRSHYEGKQASNQYIIKVYLSPADPTISAGTSMGRASYAANALVFAPRTPSFAKVSDGLSNTIAYAEHYANRCSGVSFDWLVGDFPSVFDPPIADGTRMLRRTTFADQLMGDVVPVTEGDPPRSIGSLPNATFQTRPRQAECDPRLPQTPHSGGMIAGLLDGSVRTLPQGIAASVFWSAVTPYGGEPLNNW